MKRLNTRSLRRRLLLSAAPMAALAASAAFAMTATAQDGNAAADADRDVIVVTGFRASLDAALSVKRNETGVVDAIMAEDIADFPDLNLAESLQRIPGISITRANGEGRQITVRGLNGTFTRVRINGMEALSTTGGSDASGGSNRGRAFDFNTFASDLFNEIVIRKTQSASIEEGSLGANVELHTGQPFDYGSGLTAAVTGQIGYSDLSEETSPRLAGLISYTNPDETFGVLVSAAYSDRLIVEEGFSTVRFDDLGEFRSVNGDVCGGTPQPTSCQTLIDSYYARIPRYGRLTHQQERLGLTGSMQFRPTPVTTISLDALYSDYSANRDEEFLEVFIRGNTDNVDVTDFTINSDGVLSRLVGTLQPDTGNGIIPARSEHRFDNLNTEFKQFTALVEHDFSDALRGNMLFGTTQSVNDNPIQATIFYDAANPVVGYTYDFTQNPETPAIDFGSLDVTDPASFLFTQFRNRPQQTTNSFNTAQANLEFDLNETFTLSGGVSWKRYAFETQEVRTGGDVEDILGAAAPVTDELAGLVTGFGNGLGGSGYATSWVSADFDAAVALIDLLNLPGSQRDQSTRGVKEEDTGGYVQIDFNTVLGNMPVRGDVGVRYVETTTTATGIVNGQTVVVERSYEDTLPAVNVVIEPRENFMIRGGLAKVMARPNLASLTPGGSLGTFSGPPFEYSLGNPALDPFRATAYDLSFEWYFQEEALLALGLFYKDIDSFSLAGSTIDSTFSQLGLPASTVDGDSPLGLLLAAGQDPAVTIEQQVNGGAATLQGFELVYQQPFSALPAPFDRFGFVGNFTHVESDEIINFSPNAYNATLYYEDDRFSARLVASQRDAYRTRRPSTSQRTLGREERGVAETFNLDAAVSWHVNDSIQLTFEAINLTDEFEHQTFDALELPTLYHHTGTEFLIGMRWRN